MTTTLQLKTEKLERENLAMKTAALEQENARLRAEMGKDRTAALSSLPSTAPVVTSPAAPKRAHLPAVATQKDASRARQIINAALDSIPKNDPRREMTAKAVPVSAVEVAPVAQSPWTGVYVGINAGYGGNSIDASSETYSPYAGFSSVFIGAGSIGVGGPLAGGQVGYNHQFTNNLVIGAETELDYADINDFSGSRRNSNGFAVVQSGVSQSGNGTNYSRIGLNWLGTTRIRLGYALGNFLPYISGGVAYGELISCSSQNLI